MVVALACEPDIITPRPPIPPGWLPDPRSANGSLRRRQRGSDPWQDFSEWCSRRRLEPLASNGFCLAAYLTDRLSEVEEEGRLAHCPGRLIAWVQKIDAVHIQAGLAHPELSQPIVELLARYRLTWRRIEDADMVSASRRLRRVVRAIPTGLLGDRDSAMILTGVLGALPFVDLTAVLVGDVDRDPGDGFLLRAPGRESFWLGSVDARGLCAPCTLL